MPLQVLLLYPPTSLTQDRVVRDLEQRPCPSYPLTWLKLQDNAIDAPGSSTRSASASPLHHSTRTRSLRDTGPIPKPSIDHPKVYMATDAPPPTKPLTRSTTRNRESLRAWKSQNVTFDMTHEIATIPYYGSSAESQDQHRSFTRSIIKTSAQAQRGLVSGFETTVSMLVILLVDPNHRFYFSR